MIHAVPTGQQAGVLKVIPQRDGKVLVEAIAVTDCVAYQFTLRGIYSFELAAGKRVLFEAPSRVFQHWRIGKIFDGFGIMFYAMQGRPLLIN